ncbi:MAG: histidine kinase [Saprospiraceae bacterium]
MKNWINFLYILCGFSHLVFGQIPSSNIEPLPYEHPDIVFNNLSEKDGLSYNLITSMVEDQNGLLWIGTLFGLNRFDGKRFEVFHRNKKDSTTILQNTITDLCVDFNGILWGSTEDGIFRYNAQKNNFQNYPQLDPEVYSRFHVITADKSGQIWCGSSSGLAKLNQKTAQFEFLSHSEDKYSISDNWVGKNSLELDPNGKGLWITTSKGINYYDFETKRFINYQNAKDTSIFNNHNVGALHVSKSGMIWFLDQVTKEIKGFRDVDKGIEHIIPLNGQLKSIYGGFIFETSYHHLWYSSNSYETIRIEYLKHIQYDIVQHKPDNPASIIGDYVAGAFEDKDKTVWLGTIAGISRFNFDKLYYRIKALPKVFPELDQNWAITCLAQNPWDKSWWVGTRTGHIYIHHPNRDETIKVNLNQQKVGINEWKFITDIEFIDGKALICDPYNYTYFIDPKSKKLTRFTALEKFDKNYKVRLAIIETDSTYLLANNEFNIIRWNSKTHLFQRLKFDQTQTSEGKDFTPGWLNGYKNKGAWMIVYKNVLAYIHPGDTIIQTKKIQFGSKSNIGGFLNSLIVDHMGNVWLSMSSQGIYKVVNTINSNGKLIETTLTHWDSSDGLVNENLMSALEDSRGNIWCSSFNKLSIFDPKFNYFYRFKVPISENNSFYYSYTVNLSNGNILTNMKGNLIEFFPERMNVVHPANEPIISIIELPNRKIFISSQQQIDLEPDENFLTIGFGCMSVNEYFAYHMEYILEGVNQTWVITNDKAEATYTNLPAGVYTFKVRAVSSDGSWKSSEKVIKIHIKAKFYNTWWFFMLITMTIGLILMYVIRVRLKNIQNISLLKSKAQVLEKEKTSVMYENLKQHLNPHFLFNSLTSLSSLIRIDPKKAGDFLDKMSKVYRYILRNKDNETVALVDELNFVDMYVQLQKTRFEKGFEYISYIPEDFYHRKIVPVTLQNLIENALKHNTADTDSPLIVELFIEGNYLVVQNNLQVKSYVETSNKQGLQSMISLYRFLSNEPIIIDDSGGYYKVKIPLL